MPLLDAATVYHGSDAAQTRRYLATLEALGPNGRLAAALFRACKASARAKQYRGRSANGTGPRYRDLAYARKQEALVAICTLLLAEPTAQPLVWGWAQDAAQPWYAQVLYVELPHRGQVSFHSPVRGPGPAYTGSWDGAHASLERILQFCDTLATETQTLSLFA
jgi:hypothetical protein